VIELLNLVRLPAGTLEIAEGCSGRHFLIVGLAMAALYGEIFRDSVKRRVLWLALMGALAILSNWVRIFAIVTAAYATDMQSFLVTVDHYWFGWGVFAVSFAAFLWLANRWSPPLANEPVGPTDAQVGADVRSRPSLRNFAAALVLMSVLPAAVYVSDLWRGAPEGIVTITWPVEQGAWNGPQGVTTGAWEPDFVHASAAELREYDDAQGRATELCAVAYRTQRRGAKLVSYGNSLLGRGGELQTVDERIVRTATGAWLETTVVDRDDARSLIWTQYRIGNRSFARPQLSQLWYGIAALTDRPLSVLIALRTNCDTACNSARERLSFAAARLQPSVGLETVAARK